MEEISGKRFSELGLSPETLKVISQDLQFERATPVQEATIPLFCGNKDVSVDACTGSGKTLAFVIPTIERLRRISKPLKRHQVGAIVISPTRELSQQIFDVAKYFIGTIEWASLALLVGGRDPQEDVSRLKGDGGTFIIGTPGRIDDIFVRCGFLDLKSVEILVLDEADRLLDMGFERQLDSIMKKIPRQRRTGLFSATQTDAVKALARAGLRNPVRVAVAVEYKVVNGHTNTSDAGKQITPSSLHISYRILKLEEKIGSLLEFLNKHKDEKVIVYFLTCACVDYFSLALDILAKESSRKGSNKVISRKQIHILHGRMKQAARESSLSAFSSAASGILLATDVAARGLDIPDVQWVVQYDAPQDPSSFIHRCGRTARMGKSGNAIIFLTPEEESYVQFMSLRKVPMTESASDTNCLDSESSLAALRAAAEQDRQLMEIGTRAFVSYIRAYKEHLCKYIFRVSDLQMGWLASSFSILRLPKMKEIKKAAREAKLGNLPGYKDSTVDPETIPFKDKKREKQRQMALAKRNKESQSSATQGTQISEKAKNTIKRKDKQTPANVRLTATKRRTLETRQELADLHDDYALLRKLKKGKISQKEYDQATEFDMIMDTGTQLVDAALQKKAKKRRKKAHKSAL